MRTKTLILAAALCVAGVTSSTAQVFSKNAVGYYNIDLRSGYNLIANQFINGDNNINTVFPNVEDGSLVLIYNSALPANGGQKYLDALVYVADVGWVDASGPEPVISTAVISPGSGVFFYAPTPRTITLVGEVPETSNGTLPTKTIPPLYSIVSHSTPQQLGVDTAGDAIPAGDNDLILFFNSDVNPQKFKDALVYVGGVGWVDGSGPEPVLVNPTPLVGQAFFYNNASLTGASISWSRTFDVQ